MSRLSQALRRDSYGATGYFRPDQYADGSYEMDTAEPSYDSAMSMLAVFASVKLIAEDIARVPQIVYKRGEDDDKDRDRDHPTYRLLHDSPNPEMTAVSFKEAVVGQAVLRGNGFANIERDNYMRPLRMWPMRSDRMAARHNEYDGRLQYKYLLPSGEPVILEAWEVFHLRGFSPNGVWGYSPIAQARAELRAAMASRDWNNAFYRNGANPGGVLMHPGPEALSDTARTNMENSWNNAHRGLTNAHRIAILEEGVTYQSVGISPEDAEWVETQRFNTEQVARLFRLAPYKIGDFSRATFNNIEESNIDHVVSTLDGWFVRYDQQATKDLLPSNRFAEHNRDALMRGRLLDRYRAYAIGINWGFWSPNEVRVSENKNKIKGGAGDVYLTPVNMQNQDQLLEDPQDQQDQQDQQNGRQMLSTGADMRNVDLRSQQDGRALLGGPRNSNGISNGRR